MNLFDFKATLKNNHIPTGLSVQLQSLWYDAKGDWHKAHSLVDSLSDRTSAHVHAYLHRKEGDLSNARYWYSRAGRPASGSPLEKEWEELVVGLL